MIKKKFICLSLPGMFTIKFKRELVRCCYCLRGRLTRRQQDNSNGVRKSLLFQLKPSSVSSDSSRNKDRLSRMTAKSSPVSSSLYLGCGYSFVSPSSEVMTSSSHLSLSSLGREQRVNFFISGQRI